jgi:hypothetical protein
MVALAIVCLTAKCDYYAVTISDIVWTTGLRQNINTSLDMSCSAIGAGTYRRYPNWTQTSIFVRLRKWPARSRSRLITMQPEEASTILAKAYRIATFWKQPRFCWRILLRSKASWVFLLKSWAQALEQASARARLFRENRAVSASSPQQ